jgi:phosphatidylserine/phosphatidylglycerophosphate/cardiolipin synthase-like enzyme
LYKAFIGSANYTQNAFHHQRELLVEIHDTNIDEYCRLLEKESIFCHHPESETLICVHNDGNYYRRHIHEDRNATVDTEIPELEHVTVPLFSRKTGEVQHRGGLNWGQRPGRKPNQAYIQLPPEVYNSDFFSKSASEFYGCN